MTKTLVILAGGASSRMKNSEDASLTSEERNEANTRSKALLLLRDRPWLDYLLYHASQAGIIDVIIVTNADNSLFKEYYGVKQKNNAYHGLNISYAVQVVPSDKTKPMGTADAVLQAMEQYPQLQQQTFLVCNSDNLYSINAFALLIKEMEKCAFINYDRAALAYPLERISKFALTQTNSQGFLEAIIEKPLPAEMEHYRGEDGTFRVSMNIFKFYGPTVYPYLQLCPITPERNEKELPTMLRGLIKDQAKSVKAIPLAEHVPDLTAKNDIKVMNAYLSQHLATLNWALIH